MLFVKVTLALVAASSAAHAATTSTTFNEGDSCGVEMSNFLEDDFLGSYTVAGTGCTLADGADTCFCAPDLQDGENLSQWKWQCGDTVQFGPQNEKVCPASVPVPKQYGVDSIYFTEAMLGVPVACDPDIHPTGYPGDEVCAYSECEDGGEYSAICACVDLSERVENGGTQWFCLHATCQCEATAEEADVVGSGGAAAAEPSSSGAVLSTSAVARLAIAAAAAALV